MVSWKRTGLFIASILVAACGDDGDGGGSGGASSYSDIADEIASPTGTVSASSAPDIAREFEKINQGAAGSIGKQDGTTTQACPAGGKMSFTASGNSSSARTVISYDNCCYQASCCMNGGGTWYFSGTAGAAYSYCGSYSLKASCGSAGSSTINYQGCFDTKGWVYSVKVGTETFAVSGNYSNGNGTLNVKGENGSFMCTYSSGKGSCSGSSGSFSF